MQNSVNSNTPQPPKQSAYMQSSNPVSRKPEEEQRNQTTQPSSSSSSSSSPSYSATTASMPAPAPGAGSGSLSRRLHGDAPPAIHRTADSQPSSDDKLAQLERENKQLIEPEGKRGHIDLEYGIEQQPREGYIANAVQGNTENTPRVQPGAHAGPVGGTPGYEQDTAAQMDRKRAEHDLILGEDAGKAGSAYAQRRQVREDKLSANAELDVQGAVKDATGNVSV